MTTTSGLEKSCMLGSNFIYKGWIPRKKNGATPTPRKNDEPHVPVCLKSRNKCVLLTLYDIILCLSTGMCYNLFCSTEVLYKWIDLIRYASLPPLSLKSLAMAVAKARAFTVLLIIMFYATPLQKPTIVDGANDLVTTSTTIAFNYDSTQTNLEDFKQINVSITNGAVWLTPDPRTQQESQMGGKAGWFLYNTPLTMLPNITSFHTSFHFQIITPLSKDLGGDGLAFFISPYHTIPDNSGGESLGIANVTDPSRHLFTV